MWSQELRLILQVIVLKHLKQIDTRFPLERKYLHELYMHTNVYFLNNESCINLIVKSQASCVDVVFMM